MTPSTVLTIVALALASLVLLLGAFAAAVLYTTRSIGRDLGRDRRAREVDDLLEKELDDLGREAARIDSDGKHTAFSPRSKR